MRSYAVIVAVVVVAGRARADVEAGATLLAGHVVTNYPVAAEMERGRSIVVVRGTFGVPLGSPDGLGGRIGAVVDVFHAERLLALRQTVYGATLGLEAEIDHPVGAWRAGARVALSTGASNGRRGVTNYEPSTGDGTVAMLGPRLRGRTIELALDAVLASAPQFQGRRVAAGALVGVGCHGATSHTVLAGVGAAAALAFVGLVVAVNKDPGD